MSTPFGDTEFISPAQIQLDLAILSRPGGRAHNEDACGHWNSDSHLCCVVADGAGGHGGGDIASKLAVRHILERCASQPIAGPGGVHEVLRDANRQVIDGRAAGGASERMHTTAVALFIDLDAQQALWGHVGDSRLYVFRRGALRCRTRDHSVVQSLVDAGMLPAEQARHHAQRSELLCALGSEEQDLHIGVSADPWVIAPGDVFLLCTDGLWEYVDDGELERSLRASSDPRRWLAELEALVLHNAAHKPNHDNFSALTVWAGEAR